MFIFNVVKGPFIEDFFQCVTYEFYTAYWQEQLYTTFTLLFMFILPLVLLVTTYVSTFRAISGNSRQNKKMCYNIFNIFLFSIASERMFQCNNSGSNGFNGMHHVQTTNRQKIINRAKVKSLRISVVIVAAFFICWTPYYVMMIIFMFLNPDKTVFYKKYLFNKNV